MPTFDAFEHSTARYQTKLLKSDAYIGPSLAQSTALFGSAADAQQSPSQERIEFFKTHNALPAFIRNPELAGSVAIKGIESRRLSIYQSLFYNNIENFIANGFPILKKILPSDQWHRLVRLFLQEGSCDSPYFLDIAQEFLIFMQSASLDEALPAFFNEMAYYEWLDLQAQTVSAPTQASEGGEVSVSPVAFLQGFHYPVHQIGPDYQPDAPLSTPVYLVVYRKPCQRVGFIEMNQASAEVLSVLQGKQGQSKGLTIKALYTELAQKILFDSQTPVSQTPKKELAKTIPETLKSHIQALLQGWHEKGLIWIFAPH